MFKCCDTGHFARTDIQGGGGGGSMTVKMGATPVMVA